MTEQAPETLESGSAEIHLPGGKTVVLIEPKRWQFDPNLGGAVEYRGVHVLYSIAKHIGGWFGEFVGSFLVHTLEIIEPEMVQYVKPLIDEILAIPELPAGFREFLENLRDPQSFAGAPLLAGLGSTVGSAAVGSLLPVLFSPATYWLAGNMTPARPSPAEAWAMRWRGMIDGPTLQDQLRDTGWHPTMIEAFKEIIRPRLSGPDLFAWLYKTGGSEDAIKQELLKQGWDAEDILRMRELTRQVPGPGDQVRFALREAWRDDVAARFGYDEDMPAKFTEWMSKLGFDPIWAKNFWRSHWDLPSIQLGFEMLQRRIISVEDIDTLLRVGDIPSFWREGLKKVAYQPYTRVDVRRMHQIGILTDAQLIDAYQDLGFDLEHATGMAEFTIQYNAGVDKEYTKGEILNGYRLKALSREEALELLLDNDYSQEYSEYLLTLEDYKVAQQLRDDKIEIIEDLFVEGDIDEFIARAKLGELGLRGEQVEVLIDEWKIAKEKAIARPSKSEVRNYYKQAIISRDQARQELFKRHVPDIAIGWAMEEWDNEIAAEQQDALEKAQREQERLETATFKTERMIEVQRINVLIAVQRTVIADAQLALTEIRPPLEVGEMDEAIRLLDIDIRRKQFEIQEVRVLVVRTEELIRTTPEPEIVERLQSELDDEEEAIAQLLVEREQLQTEIAELEIIVVDFPKTPEAFEAEREQARLLRDIEEMETEIARKQAFITITRNVLQTTPEPEVLEELRVQIAGLEEDVATLQSVIAQARATIAETTAELERMPTPAQAEELLRKIIEAKAEISRLQLAKARVPVTPE